MFTSQISRMQGKLQELQASVRRLETEAAAGLRRLGASCQLWWPPQVLGLCKAAMYNMPEAQGVSSRFGHCLRMVGLRLVRPPGAGMIDARVVLDLECRGPRAPPNSATFAQLAAAGRLQPAKTSKHVLMHTRQAGTTIFTNNNNSNCGQNTSKKTACSNSTNKRTSGVDRTVTAAAGNGTTMLRTTSAATTAAATTPATAPGLQAATSSINEKSKDKVTNRHSRDQSRIYRTVSRLKSAFFAGSKKPPTRPSLGDCTKRYKEHASSVSAVEGNQFGDRSQARFFAGCALLYAFVTAVGSFDLTSNRPRLPHQSEML